MAGTDFFLRTIPLFDGGSDVGMVLSPQCFHNLNGAADVFNHGNIHFWEYMQPGYDALGFISCTGTNFLMRANAFIDVGPLRRPRTHPRTFTDCSSCRATVFCCACTASIIARVSLPKLQRQQCWFQQMGCHA